MMNALWIAKTGMSAQQTNMDVVSHNLANVSTTAYKKQNAIFQDLMYQNLRQVGSQSSEQNTLPVGMHLGMGVNVVGVGREFTQGALQETKNQLDIAINGDGFFQIQMPDGTTAYTRDGSFKPDINGVVDAEGRLLMGINPPPSGTVRIEISSSGLVQAFDSGSKTTALGQIELASFVNAAGLEPLGGNLYRESVASGTPNAGNPTTNGLGEVKQGFLENSNVNVVQELVTMIQTQRAYEMNSKAISTTDQMLAKLSQL